jgi:hypothetical protein
MTDIPIGDAVMTEHYDPKSGMWFSFVADASRVGIYPRGGDAGVTMPTECFWAAVAALEKEGRRP